MIQFSILFVVMITVFSSHAVALEKAEPPDTSKSTFSGLSFFQKGRLNDPIMTIDNGPHRAKLDQHIYQVREGSIGGYDAVGGNCGCN